jgi:hypothetical protein
MSDSLAQALESAILKVSEDWKKAKQQADKEDRVTGRALERMRYRTIPKTTVREATFRVMERAYNHASSNGRYLANARQIMYAARPLVLELTDGGIWRNSNYFTQTLLKDYIEIYEPAWVSRVVWDARGHLSEPHMGKVIGIGGAEVMEYVQDWTGGDVEVFPSLSMEEKIKTVGPRNRFGAVLFIEKEGFDPILSAAGLAEKYDLAIMSTKGVPVGAACELVRQFGRAGVRVFVLHDFDLAGFKIVRTLRMGTRLAPAGALLTLGLRLVDVEGLQMEPVVYQQKADPRCYLRRCGATDEECHFLARGDWHVWEGERVELNAMTSEDLIAYLERKLQEHGVGKVVPAPEVLAQAYRRARYLQRVEQEMEKVRALLVDQAGGDPSDGLQERVKALLAEGAADNWDQAVWQLAAEVGWR